MQQIESWRYLLNAKKAGDTHLIISFEFKDAGKQVDSIEGDQQSLIRLKGYLEQTVPNFDMHMR